MINNDDFESMDNDEEFSGTGAGAKPSVFVDGLLAVFKALPLTVKFIVIFVVIIIVVMFLAIVALGANYQMEEESREAAANEASNTPTDSGYWWPVGSNETTEENGKIFATGKPASVAISSGYGTREHPVDGVVKNHKGVDLVGDTTTPGVVNVIAAKSGTVLKVNNNCTSFGNQSCGGGYGNYVEIQHSDGLYTFYGHLHQNSITVKEGEAVTQGQVIGKMGSSGKSTGTHLHFEIRTSASGDTVNPLDYISADNPRPTNTGTSSNLLDMLAKSEGGPTDGNGNYKVICNKGDIPTVGHGVTLKYNADALRKYGVELSTNNDYYNYCGKSMDKDKVDKVFADIVAQKQDGIRMETSKEGFNLNQQQLDALTSLEYNCGNIKGFADAYRKYGSTENLCTNWWHKKAVTMKGKYVKGLYTRRQKECNLFVNGVYDGSY